MRLDEGKRTIEVQTASVTIRTMVVGKRQFTIAMLRQLPQRIITPEAEIWGYVKYPLGDFRFHIIFVDANELARMSVRSFQSLHSGRWIEDLHATDANIKHVQDAIYALTTAQQLFIAV